MSKELNLKNALLEIYRNPRLYKSRRRTPQKLERSYQLAIDKLNLSHLQIEFVATYFGKTEKLPLTFADVCNHIGVLINYEARKSHQELITKSIIQETKIDRIEMGDQSTELVYNLSMDYIDIILENGDVDKNKKLPPIHKLCSEILLIGDKKYETLNIYARNFYKTLSHYRKLKLVQALEYEDFTFTQLWFLLRVVDKSLKKNENDYSTTIMEELRKFEWGMKILEKYKFLSSPENTLVTKGFIELKQNDNLPILCSAKLGDRTIELLKEDGVEFLNNHKQKEEEKDEEDGEFSGLITHSQIKEIPLFYNQKEKEQIDLLMKCLDEDKFNKLTQHLSEKGITEGICSIFYGEPGTGKTESVFQLAKQLKRDIIQVNIASCKSQWYGQSQKNIKAIFDDYKKKSKGGKYPILLLNEADALMSTRSESDLVGHNTENAIQNVFLEELENFRGIMIATTNLAQNLDNAFERRFLFKIKFNQPEEENAIKIWQNNINFLNYNEAQELVNNFKFSGGQIRNIAKKVMIEEVLSTKVTYHRIVEFCLQEKFEHNLKTVTIGFKQ